MADRPKRFKKEPETSDEEGARAQQKQAASPAQEATRAQIQTLEAQKNKLCRLRGEGKLDSVKASFQIRVVEEELRKAHSKLRRLLNEAERQRRRRERLRGRTGLEAVPVRNTPPADDAIMSTLKSCTRFQDFVRELSGFGFNLTSAEEQQIDPLSGDNNLPEVDGVKVEVELIEGDEEFAPEIKNEYDPLPIEVTSVESINIENEDQERWHGESYRQWYERQIQLQQKWEEKFMREQMELTRSLLESITTTFLHGVQQVISNLQSGRRFPAFTPDPPPP